MLRNLAVGMNHEGSINRPKPGNFYMLWSGDISRHNGFCNCLSTKAHERGAKVEHVGIIVNADGNTWKTADAGQPSSKVQAALYCDRTFNAATGLLIGEYDGDGKARPYRPCAAGSTSTSTRSPSSARCPRRRRSRNHSARGAWRSHIAATANRTTQSRC